MDRIEKMILGAIIALIIFLTVSVDSCVKKLERKGGISQVLIGAGKEIKRIKKEINN